ncbi:hypothetical protein F5051DRAFT_391873 [Lentinula edodes]|nr:hypothetical protein F5051DRAFT_391873 [Lentinula edodes]KAJ3894757.1 hypothetical protein GG344DRAFT_73754 [Lentinula edodes]
MVPSYYVQLQNKLFRFIDQADFDFALPKLSRPTWEIIINDNDERERLEFIGDFYMAAAVGENLCRCLPNGTPHQYTVARSALTSNSTYSAIMKRLGFSNPQDDRKSPGDAFESIIGAKKKEDSVSLDKWFQTYYMRLLIYIADACRSLAPKGKAAKPRPLLTLIRLRSIGQGSPATRKICSSLSPRSVQVKRKQRHILKSPTIRSRRTIDLTIDSDQEDNRCHGIKDDDGVAQISFEEFNKSQIPFYHSMISPHHRPTTRRMIDFKSTSVSASALGTSTNPIVVD